MSGVLTSAVAGTGPATVEASPEPFQHGGRIARHGLDVHRLAEQRRDCGTVRISDTAVDRPGANGAFSTFNYGATIGVTLLKP